MCPYHLFQFALISYVTTLAPPSLTATAISLMSSILWKMGKGVSWAVVVRCSRLAPCWLGHSCALWG